ncbi:rho guanine nucleotide exchange factor 25 [Galendromus occidentalis]|uniref:Rho guanine nucleotide exchange factor 25 n=1 Tax=Galendromus occidentalis TaxID=34638 RepID=A0AAJ7L6Q1_9ACAR|nr:rho guanine nucleotide exchange factor 25 [Galendromus occidentalis]
MPVSREVPSSEMDSEVEARFRHRLDAHGMVDGCTKNGHIIERSENATDKRICDESHRGKISTPSSGSDFDDEENAARIKEIARTMNLERRRCALEELVETEKSYIDDLEKVVGGYMKVIDEPIDSDDAIQVPDDLMRGKIRFVFGNIKEIYDFHRNSFLAKLERCREEPEQLGRVFKSCERQMNMYVRYHQNKPYSEYIVSEYDDNFFARIQQQLGHTLTLSDLLIKPVQRPMMYKLLLSSILKMSKKAEITSGIEDLEDAVKMMHLLPQMSNDMLEIGRIQGFEGRLGKQEKLLRKGQLLVLDMSPGSPCAVSSRIRFKQRRVFLFEQIIIFCEMIDGKTKFSKPTFIFKHSLSLNKTKLHYEGMEPLQFLLTTRDEINEGESFVLQAPSEKDRREWIESIERVLGSLLDFRRALESPIAYHKGLGEDTPSPTILESPLPPHMMLRVSSVKKGWRKKPSSAAAGGRDDPSSCAEEVDSGGGSALHTSSTERKTFLRDFCNIFRPLKRLLKDKNHTHI